MKTASVKANERIEDLSKQTKIAASNLVSMSVAADQTHKMLAIKDTALAESNAVVMNLKAKLELQKETESALEVKTSILEATQVQLASKAEELSDKNKKMAFLESELMQQHVIVNALKDDVHEAKVEKGNT